MTSHPIAPTTFSRQRHVVLTTILFALIFGTYILIAVSRLLSGDALVGDGWSMLVVSVVGLAITGLIYRKGGRR